MSTSNLEVTGSLATIVSFVSPVNGSGRTSALTNVAWILASNGKRVLTIDWCAKTPRVHDYLRPFQLDVDPAARSLGEELANLVTPPAAAVASASEQSQAVTAPSGGPEPGKLYTYGLPASEYNLSMVGSGLDAPAFPTVDAFELRWRLRQTPYDYILIDCPLDNTITAVAYVAVLSDVAAICFPSRPAAVRDAATIADEVRHRATAGIRVLALPQIDIGEPRRSQARGAVRNAFSALVGPPSSDGAQPQAAHLVEVPNTPYDTFDEVLAVLADESAGRETILSAYEQATAWLTRNEVTAVAPVPDSVRRRYLRGVRLAVDDAAVNFFMAYAPTDRPWADWVREQLQRAGAQVRMSSSSAEIRAAMAEPQSTVLAILSPQYLALADHPVPVPPGESDWAQPEFLGVLVDGDPPGEEFLSIQMIDLRQATAVRARALLLARFGLIASSGAERDTGSAPRFPRDPDRPLKSRLPSRNPGFIGRDSYLERLRDHLLGRRSPVTLTGGAGVGKSEIVRELAYRFAYDYDLIWWVPAQDIESMRAGLGALGVELGITDTSGAPEATLTALAGYHRWLLIYDNADTIEALNGLLPDTGSGHVLITSREDGAHELSTPVEVMPFKNEESVEMLRWRMPGIEIEDARVIARSLEHLPLALGLVTAWMQENSRLLERLGNSSMESVRRCVAEVLARLAQPPPEGIREVIPGSHTSSVAKALAITLSTLETEKFGQLSIRLAEMNAFLSPDGVSLHLLRSAPMLTQLAAADAADPGELLLSAVDVDQVLLWGHRFALFDVAWGREARLQMHRAVQVLLRERMPEEQRAARQIQALRGLAGYAPSDPVADDDRLRYLFDDLQPHLVPSGALESDDIEVRHWVVKQIRYLYRLSDGIAWRSALRLAEQALTRWTEAGPFDDLSQRLCVQMANLYRGLGQYREALDLDERVLEVQRRDLGLRHVRTLMTGRGRGGDLRGLGRFADALVEDEATFQGFRMILGDDHPGTRMAAHNLASSFFLFGDPREALRLEQQEKERRLRLFGSDDPRTWASACAVGTFLRETGQYQASLATLREALNRIHDLRPPGHQDELRIIRSLAVTERRVGSTAGAKKRSTDAYNGYRKLFGDDHPFTRGALLSLAVDYYRAGDATDAVDQATRCLRGYERRLGRDHPFTGVCSVNLAIFNRALGQLDQAVSEGARGLGVLTEQLGESHPWTLAASTNQAGHLTVAGELKEAADRQDRTYRLCMDLLGRDHPYTRDAMTNLNVMRALENSGEGMNIKTLVYTDIDIPQT